MERTTQKDLERQVKLINKIAHQPEATYTRTGNSFSPNKGNYHLDWAYSGVRLLQMSTGGGVSVISNGGFGTKRELHKWMQAFIAGLTI